MSVVLRQGASLLLPILLVFSLFLLMRGHNLPGGGFVGGLVAATAFALFATANGVPAARQLLPVAPRQLMVAGLAVACVSGLLAFTLGLPYLSGLWWDQPIPVMGKLGTPFVFDVGVYLVVIGVTLTILFSLME
jgi:multicomponent Na+:H+ antiporter subunit B